MADQSVKAQAFLQRLLTNPVLDGLSSLQKEEQILQFIQINGEKLYPTLSSQAFFPGKPWEEIRHILSVNLVDLINPLLYPELKHTFRTLIQMTFLDFITQVKGATDKVKEQLYEFVLALMNVPLARREYSGVLTALNHSAVDRYLDQVYSRREYVYFELTKVQRLKMSKEEVKQLVRVIMLLKPVVAQYGIHDAVQSGGSVLLVQPQFVEKALDGLQNRLPLMPVTVLKAALNSSTSFWENRYLEATGRIAAIFCTVLKNYRPDMKKDRGAESAEKSWINTARRNARYHGYDIKMLDEFYKIAAENRW